MSNELESTLGSISSTFYTAIFHTKVLFLPKSFCQSQDVTRKSCKFIFRTKKAREKHWWNWHLLGPLLPQPWWNPMYPGCFSSTQCNPSDHGDISFPSWLGYPERLSGYCLVRLGSWAKFGHLCFDDEALFFGFSSYFLILKIY